MIDAASAKLLLVAISEASSLEELARLERAAMAVGRFKHAFATAINAKFAQIEQEDTNSRTRNEE